MSNSRTMYYQKPVLMWGKTQAVADIKETQFFGGWGEPSEWWTEAVITLPCGFIIPSKYSQRFI